MTDNINHVLSDENRLIGDLIKCVKKHTPNTSEGRKLAKGWIDDLKEWRDSNKVLIALNDQGKRNALIKEKDLLKKYLLVTPRTGWWRKHLVSERNSNKRLFSLL